MHQGVAYFGAGVVDHDLIIALLVFLDDNVGAWELQGDGSYQRVVSNGNETVCAQDTLLNHLASKS